MENRCECGGCGCGACKESWHKKDKMQIKTGDEMADSMVEIANKAWTKLMVDKMKVHWEKTMGKQMDAMAEASVKASMAYHMNMMQGKAELQESVKRIHDSMNPR